MPTCSGDAIEVDNRACLRQMFAFRGDPGKLPRMLNSCCSRRVIDEVRARLGRFFLPPNPDTSACAAALAVRRTHIHLDKVLSIGGAGAESIGTSSAQNRGTATSTFIKEFGPTRVFELTPLDVVTITNANAETLLRVKRALPELLQGFEIDWRNYFTDNYYELSGVLGNVAKTHPEWQQFVQTLGRHHLRLRAAVWTRCAWRTQRRAWTQRAGAVARILPGLRALARAVMQRATGTRILRPQDQDFKNILECRGHLNSSSCG